jgi:ankyrin repeat protein
MNERKNLDGETPMFFACKKGHLGIAMLLYSKGADIDTVCKVKDEVLSPMHIATKEGHL